MTATDRHSPSLSQHLGELCHVTVQTRRALPVPLVHVTLQVMFMYEPILAVAALKLPLHAALESQVAGKVGFPAELTAPLGTGEARGGAGAGGPTVAPRGGQRPN